MTNRICLECTILSALTTFLSELSVVELSPITDTAYHS